MAKTKSGNSKAPGMGANSAAETAPRRLIPLSEDEAENRKRRQALAGEAWDAVDAKAKDEIARRRPAAELRRRAARIADVMEREFPGAVCALHYSTPLQLLVATILSAQCTDERVNLVTPALFRKYPEAADFAAALPGELEQDIRSTGFFNNKARSIRAACCELIERYGGEVPRTMEELAALPGVGRKTAAVIRANAFGLPGITVDTHVQRIAARLRLTDDTDPVRIEFDLGSLLPAGRWSQFSHAIVLHGRKTCKARKPACAACPLQTLCPSAGRFD